MGLATLFPFKPETAFKLKIYFTNQKFKSNIVFQSKVDQVMLITRKTIHLLYSETLKVCQFTLRPFETLLFSGLPIHFQYGDRKEKNLSNDRNSKLHFVIWQKTASVEFCQHEVLDWDFAQIFKSIWKPNPWMDFFEKKFYRIRIYSIFCRASPFHREWLALINILMI